MYDTSPVFILDDTSGHAPAAEFELIGLHAER